MVELPASAAVGTLDFKRGRGGFLVQDRFYFLILGGRLEGCDPAAA